jgi:hypothetical protein
VQAESTVMFFTTKDMVFSPEGSDSQPGWPTVLITLPRALLGAVTDGVAVGDALAVGADALSVGTTVATGSTVGAVGCVVVGAEHPVVSIAIAAIDVNIAFKVPPVVSGGSQKFMRV